MPARCRLDGTELVSVVRGVSLTDCELSRLRLNESGIPFPRNRPIPNETKQNQTKPSQFTMQTVLFSTIYTIISLKWHILVALLSVAVLPEWKIHVSALKNPQKSTKSLNPHKKSMTGLKYPQKYPQIFFQNNGTRQTPVWDVKSNLIRQQISQASTKPETTDGIGGIIKNAIDEQWRSHWVKVGGGNWQTRWYVSITVHND